MGNKSSTLTITEPGANTVDDANNNNNNNLPVTDEKKLAKGGDISEDTKSHDTKEKSKKCKKESKKKSKKESKDKVDEPKVKAKKASKTDKSPSETIELRVGQMLEVVDRIEDSVAHQLQANNASQQNTLMRRTLIHKPAWRESLTSLRSTDLNIYKVGVALVVVVTSRGHVSVIFVDCLLPVSSHVSVCVCVVLLNHVLSELYRH